MAIATTELAAPVPARGQGGLKLACVSATAESVPWSALEPGGGLGGRVCSAWAAEGLGSGGPEATGAGR